MKYVVIEMESLNDDSHYIQSDDSLLEVVN